MDPSYAKPFCWAVSEQAWPEELGNDQEILKMAEFGKESSLYKQSLHFRGYVLNLNLRTQYIKS